MSVRSFSFYDAMLFINFIHPCAKIDVKYPHSFGRMVGFRYIPKEDNYFDGFLRVVYESGAIFQVGQKAKLKPIEEINMAFGDISNIPVSDGFFTNKDDFYREYGVEMEIVSADTYSDASKKEIVLGFSFLNKMCDIYDKFGDASIIPIYKDNNGKIICAPICILDFSKMES